MEVGVIDFGRSSTKSAPLPGVLMAEYRTCGKSSCRCARGERHGPYWRRYWREDGLRRRSYVRIANVGGVAAQIAARLTLKPPARSSRDVLADLRRLTRAMEV
jgi:hypothetical protein